MTKNVFTSIYLLLFQNFWELSRVKQDVSTDERQFQPSVPRYPTEWSQWLSSSSRIRRVQQCRHSPEHSLSRLIRVNCQWWLRGGLWTSGGLHHQWWEQVGLDHPVRGDHRGGSPGQPPLHHWFSVHEEIKEHRTLSPYQSINKVNMEFIELISFEGNRFTLKAICPQPDINLNEMNNLVWRPVINVYLFQGYSAGWSLYPIHSGLGNNSFNMEPRHRILYQF